MTEHNLWRRTELENFIIIDPKQTGILPLLWAIPWGLLSEVNIPLDIYFSVNFQSFPQCVHLAAWKVKKLRGGKDLANWAEEPNLKHEVLNLLPDNHGHIRGQEAVTSVLLQSFNFHVFSQGEYCSSADAQREIWLYIHFSEGVVNKCEMFDGISRQQTLEADVQWGQLASKINVSTPAVISALLHL